MIIVEAPFVSELMAKWLEDSGHPVLANDFALGLAAAHPAINLVSDAEAISRANAGERIYTNSENALAWVLAKVSNPHLCRNIALCKDKAAMREKLSALDPGLLYRTFALEELAEVDPGELTFPLVVKPSVGFISFGVHVVDCAEQWGETVAAIEREVAEGTVFPESVINGGLFIVEGFIEGQEYAVDMYFDSAGEPVIVDVMQHDFLNAQDTSDHLYYTSAELMREAAPRLAAWFAKANETLGFVDFCAHVELRVGHAEGQDPVEAMGEFENIHVIEFNPLRFAGLCGTELGFYAHGVYPYAAYLDDVRFDWDCEGAGREGDAAGGKGAVAAGDTGAASEFAGDAGLASGLAGDAGAADAAGKIAGREATGDAGDAITAFVVLDRPEGWTADARIDYARFERDLAASGERVEVLDLRPMDPNIHGISCFPMCKVPRAAFSGFSRFALEVDAGNYLVAGANSQAEGPATMAVGDATVVADEFAFGSWEGKPLMWRVLSLEEGRAMVMNVDAVCSRAYNDEKAPVDWEKSSLRAWLGGEFAETAFMAEERALVTACERDNADNRDYGIAGGEKTRDQVFCLSLDEVEALMPAQARRAIAGAGGLWWTRTVGGAPEFAVYVHNNGWVNTYGYNVDEAHVGVRPAMVVDLAALTGADANSLVRSSEYGEELLLEAMETGELEPLADFVETFGVDESWESFVVETLESVAASGDGAAIERVFDLFGDVEYLSGALAGAIGAGHSTAAATLIRHGARLDGKCREVALVNDTPELRKARKASYGADKQRFADALDGEGAGHAVRLLINQGALKPADFRGLLAAAAAREDCRGLYEWMLCPDHEPLAGVKAHWSGRRISIVRGGMHRDAPVSAEGLRLFWHVGLCKDDPETVRVMAPYLGVRDLDDKAELLYLLAREGWNRELGALLEVYRMFSINQLAEGVRIARRQGNRTTADMLLALLRSIGAGKLAAELEG